MPIVHIHMIQGRSPEKKEELIRRVTDAICETLRIARDRVSIILHEIPRENIGVGGTTASRMDVPLRDA